MWCGKMTNTEQDSNGSNMVHLFYQGLIRHFRPELEKRMKEFHQKQAAQA